MTRTNKRTIDQAKREHRVRLAAEAAADVVGQLGLDGPPVDPVAVARSERPLLRLCPGPYGNAFDGRLEFRQGRFYCYYNTKYDEPGRGHAPRTRFSLAHELGHYFIDSHHQHLRGGGLPHPSQAEPSPSGKVMIEKQANVFAADLLMPPRLFRPLANREDATMDLVRELAGRFDTSLVSTACQIVQHTDFCTAAAVVRGGGLSWLWPSDTMIQRGIYPGPLGRPRSAATRRAWIDCCAGCNDFGEGASCVGDWFKSFRGLDDLPVIEFYARVPVVDELLVLLVVPEDELADSADG